jgi:hypothetical protein
MSVFFQLLHETLEYYTDKTSIKIRISDKCSFCRGIGGPCIKTRNICNVQLDRQLNYVWVIRKRLIQLIVGSHRDPWPCLGSYIVRDHAFTFSHNRGQCKRSARSCNMFVRHSAAIVTMSGCPTERSYNLNIYLFFMSVVIYTVTFLSLGTYLFVRKRLSAKDVPALN